MTEYYCQNLLSRTNGPNVLHWFSIIRMGFGWFFGLVWFIITVDDESWLLVLLDCMMKTLKTAILHNRSFKGPIIHEMFSNNKLCQWTSRKGKTHLKQPQFWRLQSVCLFGDVFDNTLPFFFFSYLAQSQIRQMDLHVGPYALPHYTKRFRWPHVTRLCSQLWDEAHFLNHISHSVFTFTAVQRDREEEW